MRGTVGAISRILRTIIRGKNIRTSAAIAIPTFTRRVEERAAVAIRLNHAVVADMVAAVDMVAAIVEPPYRFAKSVMSAFK